jgi:hypothetical protein
MKATVRHEMTEGVTAYEEKPRDQWLFDYPAQVFYQVDLPGLLYSSVFLFQQPLRAF